MIQRTSAEELRFIHERIEGLERQLDRLVANSDAWQEAQLRDLEKYAIQPTVLDFMHGFETRLNNIEVAIDGIEEELKALALAMNGICMALRTFADKIDGSADG